MSAIHSPAAASGAGSFTESADEMRPSVGSQSAANLPALLDPAQYSGAGGEQASTAATAAGSASGPDIVSSEP
ncbi:MAG TPA: hypothetical protein VHY20_01890, partial [Pirellulales bacterium]|nr:hypothetical protein [Pirellulales bacterium]